jgi:hypothetical protein
VVGTGMSIGEGIDLVCATGEEDGEREAGVSPTGEPEVLESLPVEATVFPSGLEMLMLGVGLPLPLGESDDAVALESLLRKASKSSFC